MARGMTAVAVFVRWSSDLVQRWGGKDDRLEAVRTSCRDLVVLRVFDRLIPGLIRDPVDFPGLASII
jgi:hypothetical protein